MDNDNRKSEIQPGTSKNMSDPQKLPVAQPISIDILRQQSFQYMQDGFSIVDANGFHVDVNAAFCAMTGFSEEELIGHGPEHSYWPPEETENIRFLFNKTLQGEFAECELIFMRKGGDRFPVIVNPFSIIDDSGAISFYAATIKDITQYKMMEEALVDVNTTLEDRVAQRTDDLEKAYAELLRQNGHYRELTKRLHNVEEQERRRIARLLHDNHQQLLVAAKIRVEMLQSDSYNSDVNKSATQVLEILDQAVEVTRSLTMELAPPILYGSGLVVAMQWLANWMEEEHQLDVVVQGSLPSTPIATTASHVLFRAVRELLFNVIKHSGVRQAHVKMSLVKQQLLVTVIDKGVGFNVADTLELDRSYGLFSIQEQLQSLEGRLDIFSTAQHGTQCTLSIPIASAEIADSEELPAGEFFATETETSSTLHGLREPIRLLVVDDHAVARTALMQTLTLMEDFDVVGEAVDGLDALEKTRTQNPDVILMDVTMPRMGGIEATRSIIAEFPEIKIIGLSMHSAEEMEPQMLAVGAARYLQKHTPVEKLFAAIRGVIKRDVLTSQLP